MGKKVCQRGDQYGRLCVVKEAVAYYSPSGQTHRQVVCACECGSLVTVRTSSLRSGLTVSCGCVHREVATQSGRNSATHGMEGTPTYKAWCSMKQRCTNPHHEYYSHYGARGIRVCDRWAHSFRAFYDDMGNRPSNKHTLDRFPNNNGNYEPGNVRWATWREQNQNRRINVMLTMNGETLCVAEWSRRTGIRQDTIRWRIKNGYSVDEALTLALREKRKSKLVTLRTDLEVPTNTRV